MLTRNISRRLERLETRSAEIDRRKTFEMLLHFVESDMSVSSTLLLRTGQPDVWTHFPPGGREVLPRERQK